MLRPRLCLTVLIATIAGCGQANPNSAATSQPSSSAPASQAVSVHNIEKSLDAAQQYLDAREPLKAQAILLTLVDRAPNEVRAHELLGQVLMTLAAQSDVRGDAPAAMDFRKKAYEQYQQAVRIDANSAGLQHSAGLMAIAAGDSDAALRHFHNASKLDPSSTQFPLFAAQVLIQQRHYDQAVIELNTVLALDRDEPIAYASLAMIAMEQGKFDQALQHMAEARKIDPTEIGLRAQEAKIHRRQGNPQRGMELLIGLNQAEQAHEVVAAELAACHSALGDDRKAARAWEMCYKANPLAPNAWRAALKTSELLARAGEPEYAALWLQQAEVAAPNHPDVLAAKKSLGL